MFLALTSEPRRTQAGIPAHSVQAGGSVHAGHRNTLVHINLTVSTLESRHAEARVAITSSSTYCLVLARVWQALVLSLMQPVRKRT